MQNSMRAISRRLRRLEKRLGLAAEDREGCALAALIEARRLRRGLPPPSPEHLAEQRGMGVVEILNAARQRAALAGRHELPGKTAS